jgi:aspartate/glutamate racemase
VVEIKLKRWNPLRKRLGCLHAHYSNIDYIENALSPYGIELIHFVDPGLMTRVTSDEHFQESDAQKKVKEQIEWIAQCHVDAILITCTNYIAILQEDQHPVSVPIIKIDEPYFEYICKVEEPQIILFTNPATVKGTIDRLNQKLENHQKSLDFEVIVIDNTFDLFMKGLKEEYDQAISEFLTQIMKKENRVISVAQLSMVDAAKQMEMPIINPLDTLISSIVNQLKISK